MIGSEVIVGLFVAVVSSGFSVASFFFISLFSDVGLIVVVLGHSSVSSFFGLSSLVFPFFFSIVSVWSILYLKYLLFEGYSSLSLL